MPSSLREVYFIFLHSPMRNNMRGNSLQLMCLRLSANYS